MNRLAPLYPDDMTAPQRAYYDAIMSRPPYQDLAEGSPLGGPFQAWVRSPTFAETIGPMAAYLRGNGVVHNRLNELAIITVGRIWSAEVEFASHSVAAIRAGISEDIVEAIRHRQSPRFDNADERAVYEFASGLNTEYAVDDAAYQALLDAVGEQGVVELIGLLGIYVMVCMTLNVFRIPVREGTPRPFPDRAED